MLTTWTHQAGDRYVVTGVTRDGQRFRQEWTNPMHALMINLWQGSVWLVRDGKRRLIKRVFN
jgi:hypothetical protein